MNRFVSVLRFVELVIAVVFTVTGCAVTLAVIVINCWRAPW